MDLINSVFHFFTDQTRHFSTKALLVCLLIILVAVADNLFSFSYFYNNSQKISQAKEITQILKEPGLTDYEKKKLADLRTNIIDHTNWKDQAWSFFTNISLTNNNKTTTAAANTPKPIVQRSYNWHFVSSSWIFIVFMIIIPFAAIFSSDLGFLQGVLVVALVEGMLLGMAWLFAKMFSYIPVIWGNPIYSYILNAVLCFLVMVFLGLIGKATKSFDS